MNDMVKLIGDLGPSGALIFAVLIVGRKFDALSDRLVTILETTVKRNTEMLQKIDDRLERCHDS